MHKERSEKSTQSQDLHSSLLVTLLTFQREVTSRREHKVNVTQDSHS